MILPLLQKGAAVFLSVCYLILSAFYFVATSILFLSAIIAAYLNQLRTEGVISLDYLTGIDMFAANLALLAFFIVAIKYVSKRTGWKKIDVFLMKAHRKAGYVLLSAGIIHAVLSFRDISTTPIVVYILGIICILSIAAAILTYVFRKKLSKKWLYWHRAATVIALVTLIAHPFLMNE